MARRPGGRSKTVKVPIAFPADMYEWLRESAYQRRVPMAQIVREAVQRYQKKAGL